MAEKSAENDAKSADQAAAASTSSSSVPHASTSNAPVDNNNVAADTHDTGKGDFPSPSKSAQSKNHSQQDISAAVTSPEPAVLSKKHRIAKAMAAAHTQSEGGVESESNVGSESAGAKQTDTDDRGHDTMEKKNGGERKRGSAEGGGHRHSPEKNAGKARVSSELADMESGNGGNDVHSSDIGGSVEAEQGIDRGVKRHEEHVTGADADTNTAVTQSAEESSGVHALQLHADRSKASSEVVAAVAATDATDKPGISKARMKGGTGLLEDLSPVASFDDEEAQGTTDVTHVHNNNDDEAATTHSDSVQVHGSAHVQPAAGGVGDSSMQAEEHKNADTHMQSLDDSEPGHSGTHGQNTNSEAKSTHHISDTRPDDVSLKSAHQHADTGPSDSDNGQHESQPHHSDGSPGQHTHAESSGYGGQTNERGDADTANSAQETVGQIMDSDTGNISSVFEEGTAACRDLSSMDVDVDVERHDQSRAAIPASYHDNSHVRDDNDATRACVYNAALQDARMHTGTDEGVQDVKANAQDSEPDFHDSESIHMDPAAGVDMQAGGGGNKGGDVCMHDVSSDAHVQQEVMAGDPLTC
jgi:hypothetical protein